MVKRATLKDVARAAGVHAGTVSRVLRPETRSLVNAETAARIDAVIMDLDYRPNVIARGLRLQQSKFVATIIPDLTNPLFPPVVRGIEEELSAAGYMSLIVNTDNDLERERESFEAMRERQVEGIIAATAATGGDAIPEVVAQGVRVVLVNRSLARHKIPAVVPDDRGGMRQAVEHVLQLGHRRIGYLSGPRDLSSASARRGSFEATLKRAGVDLSEIAIEDSGRLGIEEGEQSAGALLDGRHRPTAIVAANDLMAVGAYRAAAAREVRIPEDLSVVGFNDMPFAEQFQPPLTTVHVPHHEMGCRAAALLLAMLREPSAVPARKVTLPVRLVVRGSTGPPAG